MNLTKDQLPWVDIARRVLADEFLGADDSTVESLTIGLRGIPHTLCRQAVVKLPKNKEKRE